MRIRWEKHVKTTHDFHKMPMSTTAKRRLIRETSFETLTTSNLHLGQRLFHQPPTFPQEENNDTVYCTTEFR